MLRQEVYAVRRDRGIYVVPLLKHFLLRCGYVTAYLYCGVCLWRTFAVALLPVPLLSLPSLSLCTYAVMYLIAVYTSVVPYTSVALYTPMVAAPSFKGSPKNFKPKIPGVTWGT